MKTINVSLILSVLLFTGSQKSQAQIHKAENKQEVKIKEVEHMESSPIKEMEIKERPKEASQIPEHKESVPVKEEEVKTETQPTTDTPVKNTTTENKATKETPAATNIQKSSLPKSFTIKHAVMPVKPIIKNIPQK